MYIPIVFIFVITVLFFFALMWILKYRKFFKEAPPPKSKLTDIGTDPGQFDPPSLWADVKPAKLDGNECVPDSSSQTCFIYQFIPETTSYLPPSLKMAILGTCTEIPTPGGCFINNNTPLSGTTCIYPDSLQAEFKSHTCSNKGVPNSGMTCQGQNGQPFSTGATECFWGTCAQFPTCDVNILSFLVMNYDDNYVVSYGNGTINPLQNLYCSTLYYDATDSTNIKQSVFLEQCDIHNAGFSVEQCNATSAVCSSQLWTMTNYVVNNGVISQSKKGSIVSIQDRNTGMYLAPTGFTPHLMFVIDWEKITSVNLTLVNDAGAAPGAWWAIVPGSEEVPCQDQTNAICNSADQIVFFSGWEFINSVTFDFVNLKQLGSIAFQPNSGTVDPPADVVITPCVYPNTTNCTVLALYQYQINRNGTPKPPLTNHGNLNTYIFPYSNYVTKINNALFQSSN